MGSRPSPPPAAAPAAAPAATVTPTTTVDTSKDPAARAVARRDDTTPNTGAASLLQAGGSADVDPLSARKALGGQAAMMG